MAGIWDERSRLTLIIDASVALKWVHREAGAAEALALLDREDERVAPDWMIAEVASGLANKVRYEGASLDQAQAALRSLPEFIDRLVPSGALLRRAMGLAAELKHALYDCLYLASALDEGGRVVTADDGLIAAARRAGYAEHVERLRW